MTMALFRARVASSSLLRSIILAPSRTLSTGNPLYLSRFTVFAATSIHRRLRLSLFFFFFFWFMISWLSWVSGFNSENELRDFRERWIFLVISNYRLKSWLMKIEEEKTWILELRFCNCALQSYLTNSPVISALMWFEQFDCCWAMVCEFWCYCEFLTHRCWWDSEVQRSSVVEIDDEPEVQPWHKLSNWELYASVEYANWDADSQHWTPPGAGWETSARCRDLCEDTYRTE